MFLVQQTLQKRNDEDTQMFFQSSTIFFSIDKKCDL